MTIWQSAFLFVLKNLPWLVGIFERLTKHPLSGVWCVCWQCGNDSDTYEIGSMDIKQIGKKIGGCFYTGNKRWALLAKKEESAVTGTYQLKDKSTGTFRFGFCGENTDRLIGTWSGRVSIKSESGVEKAVVYSDGLKLFAARNLSVNSECHKKQLPFGECPKNALETMQPLR